MLGHLLLPEIEELIRARNFTALREALSDFVAPDLSELIAELPPEDQAVIFRILPRDLAAETFEYLPLEQQEQLINAMGDEEKVAVILNDMAPDDRTALLEELPAEVTKRLMSMLAPEKLAVAKQLLGYPDDSLGRLMTPDYVSIRPNWTVQEVLDHVRTHGSDRETLNVLYVTDDNGMLIDDIRVREFLLAPLHKKVYELMDEEVVSLMATDDQETAVAAFRKYDTVALPVTDTSGVLVGIITVDDVLDVAEQEATEDIQKLGGVEALEEPYMNVSFLDLTKKRARWLIVLFLGEMLTVTAMGIFEHEIARLAILPLFIPLIISSGGNSGSQAATLVIRALALGEITLRDWWRVVRREVLSGATLGSVLGTFGLLRVMLAAQFTDKYDPNPWLIASTVSLTLLGVVMFGTIVGATLPFLLKRLGADPATSSAPFIATLVDVTGLLIYFGVASLLLF